MNEMTNFANISRNHCWKQATAAAAAMRQNISHILLILIAFPVYKITQHEHITLIHTHTHNSIEKNCHFRHSSRFHIICTQLILFILILLNPNCIRIGQTSYRHWSVYTNKKAYQYPWCFVTDCMIYSNLLIMLQYPLGAISSYYQNIESYCHCYHSMCAICLVMLL